MTGAQLLAAGSTTLESKTTVTVNGVTTVTEHATSISHGAFPLAWVLLTMLGLGLGAVLILHWRPRAVVVTLAAASMMMLFALLDPSSFGAQVSVYPTTTGWLITFVCLALVVIGNLFAAFRVAWRRPPNLLEAPNDLARR